MTIPRISQNAFRILGLPGHADLDSIQRNESAMRRALKLSATKTTEWDLPWIGAIERSESAVREALGRLTSAPQNRLRERLFWFDGRFAPDSLSKSSIDSFISDLPYSGVKLASHDRALLHLLAALLNDPEFKDSARWSKSFQAWKECVADDEYWGSVLESEMSAGFEPAATSEEIENLRQEALSLAADIVASMARDALAQGHQDRFRRAANVLESSGLSASEIAKFENETFGSREDGFAGRCTEIRNECGGRIQRDDSAVEANKIACTAALARFDTEIQPELFRLTDFAGANSEISRRAREAAASLLMSLAMDYTWTNDFITSEKVLKRAKELVPSGSITSEKIDEILFDVGKSAQLQRYPKGSTAQDNSPEGKFERLSVQISADCRDGIRRDEQSVAANRKVCQKALERFDTELKPELDKLLAVVGADSVQGLIAREAAAMCLHSIAIDLTWANEFKIGEATLGEALALVPEKSTAARRISDSFDKFPRPKGAQTAGPAPQPASKPKSKGPLPSQSKPTVKKRDWEHIDPITAAPTLWTINGIGFTMYGSTNPEPISPSSGYTGNSYLTTYYFVFLAIPIFPICRYRVFRTGDKKYHFLHKAPLRTFDKWHLGISIAAIAGFFIMVNQDSGHSSYTPPPSAYATQLDKGSLANQIETNKRRIAELEGELKSEDSDLSTFSTELAPYKAEIKQFEADIEAGNPIDQAEYKLALSRHNEIVDRAKPTLLKRKKAYKEYDQLIKTTNGLIDEYKK